MPHVFKHQFLSTKLTLGEYLYCSFSFVDIVLGIFWYPLQMDYVVYYDSSSDLSSSDFFEHAVKLQVPKGRNNMTIGSLHACSWYRFRIGTTPNTCPLSLELALRTKEGEKQAVSCSCTVLLLVFFSLFTFYFSCFCSSFFEVLQRSPSKSFFGVTSKITNSL